MKDMMNCFERFEKKKKKIEEKWENKNVEIKMLFKSVANES